MRLLVNGGLSFNRNYSFCEITCFFKLDNFSLPFNRGCFVSDSMVA